MLSIAPSNAKIMIKLTINIDAPMKLNQMSRKKNFNLMRAPEMDWLDFEISEIPASWTQVCSVFLTLKL